MGFLLLTARLLFSTVFILSGLAHYTNNEEMRKYAASKNVPSPRVAVFITGIMLLLGGSSVLLGLWVNIGALLLIIFLIPTALIMHNFWAITDPMDRQNELVHFMKDLALAGASFLIWYLYVTIETVPWSIDGTL